MSELANKARKRNWLKMRLMGCESIFYANKDILTKKEIRRFLVLQKSIRLIINDFTKNSKELGFKIKPKKPGPWEA